MSLYCGCHRCYDKHCPEDKARAHAEVYTSLYASKEGLLKQELSPEARALTGLAIAVLGAKPGLITTAQIERLYLDSVGPAAHIEMARNPDYATYAQETMARDTRQWLINQCYLHVMKALCPNEIQLKRQVPYYEFEQFRRDQDRVDLGHAGRFNSYINGTTLYFSDQTEAVMARFVFDTPFADH